jgi:hypothetical protein
MVSTGEWWACPARCCSSASREPCSPSPSRPASGQRHSSNTYGGSGWTFGVVPAGGLQSCLQAPSSWTCREAPDAALLPDTEPSWRSLRAHMRLRTCCGYRSYGGPRELSRCGGRSRACCWKEWPEPERQRWCAGCCPSARCAALVPVRSAVDFILRPSAGCTLPPCTASSSHVSCKRTGHAADSRACGPLKPLGDPSVGFSWVRHPRHRPAPPAPPPTPPPATSPLAINRNRHQQLWRSTRSASLPPHLSQTPSWRRARFSVCPGR